MEIKTYKYRIKDKNKLNQLDQMNKDVKFVWNVINSASRKKWKESRKYFHKFDPYFTSITKGASEVLTINSQTIQAVIEQFHKDIHQQKKQLRYKGRKNLGWVPFKGQTIKVKDSGFVYDKKQFKFWKSRLFPENSKVKSGCFTQDILGRWYVCFVIEIPDQELKFSGKDEVGLDLGLKTTVTCSDGKELKLKELDIFDKKKSKLQQARRFKQAKKQDFHKVNKRKDMIHKFTLDLVRTNGLIVVGNVSGFTTGELAKSRYQNSWSMLKNTLELKAKDWTSIVKTVNESYTTQTCNVCGSVEGPKGIKELSVRFWVCSCGAGLNRDINAAINILNRGRI